LKTQPQYETSKGVRLSNVALNLFGSSGESVDETSELFAVQQLYSRVLG